jgi:diacylglycerol kinase (ATP)
MQGTLFLVNPRAGSGRAGRIWDELRAAMPQIAAADAIVAADPEAAGRELDQQLAGPVERMISIGGDGSIHLAVNRLVRSGRHKDIPLGLVPAGTGSDLARTLGLPRDPRQALDRALSAAPRPIDVIEVETDAGERRYVLNVASAGISGRVDELVNAQPKRSGTAFLTATLRALGSYKPFTCRVELDGQPWYEGGVFVLAVANGRSFGKGMRIAPRAEVDDGLADVVLVRPMPRWQIPLRMPRVYLGTHLDQPMVAWRRARRVRLEATDPFPPFDVDGEVMPSGSATFTVLAGALRFLG